MGTPGATGPTGLGDIYLFKPQGNITKQKPKEIVLSVTIYI